MIFLDLLQELKIKLDLYKQNLNKLFKYKNYKFYQEKLSLLTKEIRGIKLRIEKNKKSVKKNLILKIDELIGGVDRILVRGPQIKKETFEKIEDIEEIIQELEIEFGEEQKEITEKIYNKGNRFDFHLDTKEIINKIKKNIFIIDPYLNEDILELYLKNLKDKNIEINILTNSRNPKGNFVKISHGFISQHKGKFEARETEEIHDRAIFIDNKEGWVLGQSIKDAAKNKPTYLIKLKNPKKLEDIYKKIWFNSKKIK